MKAIIPVAGVGTKLRPHTHTQPKPLLPVAGKPILGHIIDNLLSAGVREQIFIVGHFREKIQEYVETCYGDKITMHFVLQEPRQGLAHAVWVARAHIQPPEPVLVMLGDTIFGEDTRRVIDAPGSILGVHQVDDPRVFGVAVLDGQQQVRRVVEKPQIPTSNFALVGLYKIAETDVLLRVLDEMMGTGGWQEREYPLAEALTLMIQQGVNMKAHIVERWFDCGRPETLLATNRILLSRMPMPDLPPMNHTVIIPPVHIAEGCEISNSIIGPYVTIAEHARIENSIIQDTILGAYSRLESITLKGSVIGNDTTLRGKSLSINIGDNTELNFDT
ncbi:MAG: sugar phosphate nucleotidyltransferase [Bacteroidia bacterium]|nr:sugar phosphate nucleotidyltransferase [Bacteroidia bacterium]